MAAAAANSLRLPGGLLLEELFCGGAIGPDGDEFDLSIAEFFTAFRYHGKQRCSWTFGFAIRFVQLAHRFTIPIVPRKAPRTILAHEHQKRLAR